MVHIKRIELTNFKSFGGTTKIPMLPGFTVVSGPNGSGKSNILDALLFCLGISTSKGMRAERLPDLVNHTQTTKGRGTVEASVTVTFDLGDDPAAAWAASSSEIQELETEEVEEIEQLEGEEDSPDSSLLTTNNGHRRQDHAGEWSITRRLRVTKQGTYTSTYYINGAPCTLTELHEELNRLRVYPEGYNVVLQGDVTSIISMNPRERREIIDELAGVAAFDRKIVLAKEKLDEVKDREERSRIVERELIVQRDRLAQDRTKAEKYQKLRAELQDKEKWETVLVWRQHKQQEWQLRENIEAGDRTGSDLKEQILTLSGHIELATTELDRANTRVKALGEDELLALQSTLVTQEAEHRQLQQRQQELETAVKQTADSIAQTERKVKQYQQELEQLDREQVVETQKLASVRGSRDTASVALDGLRQQSSAIADASDVWVQQQTDLHRQIETLQKILDPQRSEQARLHERALQLESKIQEQHQLLQALEQEKVIKIASLANVETLNDTSVQQVESLEQALAAAELELQTLQETQKRLLSEQRENQRQLDKLEAQAQVMQETSGTGATQVLVQNGLTGVCGLVAQLGRVEPRYQLALETAAGGRMGFLVVEDDAAAAAGIALLKEKRAGRATFLPLNKMRPPRFTTIERLHQTEGFIDYAVNLINYDPRYSEVFAYVFGNTVVFDILNNARRHMGQARIVTLEGDILETTGAMTGGSNSSAGSRLHFGKGGPEVGEQGRQLASLRERLQEIELILEQCARAINQAAAVGKSRSHELMEAKQQRRDSQRSHEQLQGEIKNIIAQQEHLRSQLVKNTQELSEAQGRLQVLEVDLPGQEAHLNQLRMALGELEQSQTHSEWQQIQVSIRTQEAQLQEWERSLRSVEQHLGDLKNQRQRQEEKIQESHRREAEYQTQLLTQQEQYSVLGTGHLTLSTEISQTLAAVAKVEEKLGEEKQTRDRAEAHLRERHLAKQQLEWQLEKLQETQNERREQLTQLQQQLQVQQAELPDPLPTVPENLDFEQLQKDVRSLQKRLQAMEPVNMLALEEYDRTQARLDELGQKLATLEAERTELLLRIENFTTLRMRAFKDAFDAVNQNFQITFAELSDGDGYLQLDDPEDPFSSGLNLVAHPKGKPIQRLASMSGGEKSLTALSFIFSLQRYRPSPFYAFDEVDMFLDGANVERLARMIKLQAQQAQFIVVSLRRPMIESSERTIGVTQARGAYTQVIGLKLQSKSATV